MRKFSKLMGIMHIDLNQLISFKIPLIHSMPINLILACFDGILIPLIVMANVMCPFLLIMIKKRDIMSVVHFIIKML